MSEAEDYDPEKEGGGEEEEDEEAHPADTEPTPLERFGAAQQTLLRVEHVRHRSRRRRGEWRSFHVT